MGHDTEVYLVIGVPLELIAPRVIQPVQRPVYNRYTGDRDGFENETRYFWNFQGQQIPSDTVDHIPDRLVQIFKAAGLYIYGDCENAVVGALLFEEAARAYKSWYKAIGGYVADAAYEYLHHKADSAFKKLEIKYKSSLHLVVYQSM